MEQRAVEEKGKYWEPLEMAGEEESGGDGGNNAVKRDNQVTSPGTAGEACRKILISSSGDWVVNKSFQEKFLKLFIL